MGLQGRRAARVAEASLLGALLLFVAGRCLVPMDETDLFFNLRLGEIVLQSHRVPLTNLLSFTWPDYRDVNLAWLFQIVLALAHRAGGVPATVILKTSFVLATIAILWRAGRRRGAQPALLAAALALAAWAAEPRFVERPHLVTFLGLAFTLLALERAEAGRPRALWALIPAGLVWANANSCFFLAPAVLMLYAAGSVADRRATDARRAALVAAALTPLILATPSGTGALGYIANHFRMPYLRPLQEYRAATWPIDGPFFLLAAALAAAIALAPRGHWRRFLPALALGLLGARRIRFVAEFALLAGPAVAAALTARWERARTAVNQKVNTPKVNTPKVKTKTAAIAAGVVSAALALFTVAPRVADARAGLRWLDLDVEAGLVPRAAIEFAEQHQMREHMYNDLEVGSYLTWKGWPSYPVFQDPRINGYPSEFHAVLRRADLTRGEWQALMDRFGVSSALITYPSVNPRGALFDPARWALVYQSNEALLFARRAAGRERELAELELPLTFRYDATSGLTPEAMPQPPPGATTGGCDWSLRVGDFFLVTDKPARARDAYRDAGACLDRERRRTLAGLEIQLGNAGAAARLLDDDTDPRSRLQHGYAQLRLGNAQRALDDFDGLLKLPFAGQINADATLGRALALEALHRDAEALAAFRDLLARAPNHVGAADVRAHIARLTSR